MEELVVEDEVAEALRDEELTETKNNELESS
jgi:hypothetical protein